MPRVGGRLPSQALRLSHARASVVCWWVAALARLHVFGALAILWSCCAPLAQSAERLHGKEKVSGSIPLGGSYGGVAQWLEHSAHNRVVGGSIPPAATADARRPAGV